MIKAKVHLTPFQLFFGRKVNLGNKIKFLITRHSRQQQQLQRRHMQQPQLIQNLNVGPVSGEGYRREEEAVLMLSEVAKDFE